MVVNLKEKRADVTRGEVPQLKGTHPTEEDLDQSMDTSIESLNITMAAEKMVNREQTPANTWVKQEHSITHTRYSLTVGKNSNFDKLLKKNIQFLSYRHLVFSTM